MVRYLRFSGLSEKNSETNLLSRIAAQTHVIEKGLTMAEMRHGFGIDRIKSLISMCNKYVSRYGYTNCQLDYAIALLNEYILVHQKIEYELPPRIIRQIEALSEGVGGCYPSHQIEMTKQDYFSANDAPFDLFSSSRHSLRNYSREQISESDLMNAIQLAQNAPSSCNRQQVRAYIVSDKKVIDSVLLHQRGNQGFGSMADKLIILTACLEEYSGITERNSAYVDGGIFAMNLLYALHFYRIGACSLNANLTIRNQKILRRICKIPDSHVFILIVSCGRVPDNFKVPISKRKSVNEIVQVI